MASSMSVNMAWRMGESAGALAQDKIAITDQERGDILALTCQMKVGDPVPHALGFCPRTT